MLKRSTNLFHQAITTPSKPRVVCQLRTSCQAAIPSTIKDPGWPDYFAPGSKIKSDHIYHWAPRSFNTKLKTGFGYEDMFGLLEWRWVELPDSKSIAWEATTVYMRTRSRQTMHPFRYIPTPFIKRSSMKVSTGAIIPIDTGTVCLDRLGAMRNLDQKGMSLLIRSLYSEDNTYVGKLTEGNLKMILFYLDWDLPDLEPRHSWTRSCETTHAIQMIGMARIFKQLFNQKV